MPEPSFCILCGTRLEMLTYQDGHLHPVCPKCGWAYFADPKVAAAVFLVKEDQVLLIKRVFDPMKGYWALPAGFVNALEDPARAAERECLEETGIEVHVQELMEVVTGRDHPRGADIILIYRGEMTGGAVKAGDDAEDAAFFPLDALPPLAFRATRRALGLAETNSSSD